MNTIKRALSLGALATIPFIALAACGDDNDDSPGGATGGTTNSGGSGGSGGGSMAGGSGGVNAMTGGTGGGDNTGGMAPAAGTGGVVPVTGGAAGMAGMAGSGGDVNTGGTGGAPEPVPCGTPGKNAQGQDLPAQEIPGPVTGTLTLTRDKVWILSDSTYVTDGQVLTIEPCTVIKGKASPRGTLIVSRGGKLIADGQADAPIIFTTQIPAGAGRGPGQWGGVILLGRASNWKGTEVNIEGLAVAPLNNYGPGAGAPIETDNSGILRHVLIEFGGAELTEGSEINGLTMGSVGSETVVSHVMVNTTLDDCFEWFGGTVSGDHLICNSGGDDMFDGDQGWTGTLDTAFGRAAITSSKDPNGFEMDSDNATDKAPQTKFTAQKVTMCGLNRTATETPGSATTVPSFGMVLRENVRATISDLVAIGFDDGVDIRDNAFEMDGTTYKVSITNSHLSGRLFDVRDPADANDGGLDEVVWFEQAASNTTGAAPFLPADCLDPAGPNATVTGSAVGAFKTEANWMTGKWINWSTN